MMAVLVEGISVVVRADSIVKEMQGGWERFRSLVPNGTLCFDDDLARVGFLDPNEVSAFIDRLESEGRDSFSRNWVSVVPAVWRRGVSSRRTFNRPPEGAE
jgi:hypothetical protein